MSDKPTTQDLILLEMRDLTASLGELRIQLNGVWQRVVALEGRVRNLESGPVGRTMTGSIQGLEGEFTVTPPVDLFEPGAWHDGDHVTIVYDGKTEQCKVVGMGDGAYSLEPIE